MKKYLFFLSVVSMTLFTACSKDDLAQEMSPEEQAAIIAEANLDSEVQIRLGMGSHFSSMTTRAPLESDNNGLFETPDGKYLGIYGLAQTNQKPVASPGPVAPSNIAWNSSDETKLFYVMNRNQAAKVVKVTGAADQTIGNVPFTSGTVSEVQFMNDNLSGTKIYYYPYGNWYNYHFYGYYPRVETPTEMTNKISVNYTLDGKTDIIYGKAKPTTTSDEDDNPSTPETSDVDRGFNAKYFRDKQKLHNGNNAMDELPALAMDHKLTQLRFFVKCNSSNFTSKGYGSGNDDKKFQIENLRLTKVPATWTLTIADRVTPANEGKLTGGTSPQTIDIYKMNIASDPVVGTDTPTFKQDDLSSSRVHIPYVADQNPARDPEFLGYTMIPTTEMLTGTTIQGRTDPKILYIDFKIYYSNDSGYESSEFTDQAIALPKDPGEDGILDTSDDIIGFQAGKVYNVILNIPTPEEIAMIATLDDWDWVSVTAGGTQNLNVTVE